MTMMKARNLVRSVIGVLRILAQRKTKAANSLQNNGLAA
jgi:hypothetical protein